MKIHRSRFEGSSFSPWLIAVLFVLGTALILWLIATSRTTPLVLPGYGMVIAGAAGLYCKGRGTL